MKSPPIGLIFNMMFISSPATKCTKGVFLFSRFREIDQGSWPRYDILGRETSPLKTNFFSFILSLRMQNCSQSFPWPSGCISIAYCKFLVEVEEKLQIEHISRWKRWSNWLNAHRLWFSKYLTETSDGIYGFKARFMVNLMSYVSFSLVQSYRSYKRFLTLNLRYWPHAHCSISSFSWIRVFILITGWYELWYYCTKLLRICWMLLMHPSGNNNRTSVSYQMKKKGITDECSVTFHRFKELPKSNQTRYEASPV